MTENFVTAAELMSRVLGAPEFPIVVIDHPISSATTEALQVRARQAADECAQLLTGVIS